MPAAPPDLSDGGRAEAEALFPGVSRETWERLAILAEMVRKWQRTVNLVGPRTLDEIWMRHIADGVQVYLAAPPSARIFVDLGSGAGFPGLVVAGCISAVPGAAVHLIESDQRKCAFLREAARAMGAPAVVHNERIESALADWSAGCDVVTARALAPLEKLLILSAPLLKPGTVAIFPKGQDVESELTQATKSWTMDYDLAPSRTAPDARLVIVRAARPR